MDILMAAIAQLEHHHMGLGTALVLVTSLTALGAATVWLITRPLFLWMVVVVLSMFALWGAVLALLSFNIIATVFWLLFIWGLWWLLAVIMTVRGNGGKYL